jgi:hypothetical protein
MVERWDGWHFGAYMIAMRQAEAGRHDLALQWLTRARDARSAGIMLANVPGAFDALYTEARFRAILGAAYLDASGVD